MSEFQIKISQMFEELYFAFGIEMHKIMEGDVKYFPSINFHNKFPSLTSIPVWKLDDLSYDQRESLINELINHFDMRTTIMSYYLPETLRWLYEEEYIDEFIKLLNRKNTTHTYEKVLLDSLPSHISMTSNSRSYVDYGLPYGIACVRKIKWHQIGLSESSYVEGIYTLLFTLFRHTYVTSLDTYLDRFILEQDAILK